MVQHMNCSASEKAEQPSTQPWSPRVVYIRATMKGLDCALIPFAVLKEDPLTNFRNFVKTSLTQLKEDEALLALQQAWNKPFTAIGEEQIFFLCAWSAVPRISARVVDSAGLSFGIATPGPLYKRWITTFAVKKQGEFVAWSEEVDMRDTSGGNGVSEIVLSEERMIRLDGMRVQDFKVA